jgi:hypothetical protein
MTASALEKLYSTILNYLETDLSICNVMEIVPDILHLGFWHGNPFVVQKLFKIFNKLFGENSI